MLFPMYVVSVRHLLRMSAARPHHKLKAAGLLQQHRSGSFAAALFVSHQWCSRRHPDPNFEQLPVLQAALRRLAAGTLRVQVSLASYIMFKSKPTVGVKDLQALAWGGVWYDYFSVPQLDASAKQGSQHVDMQEEVRRAVFSIPAYIEACEFFVILAPPLPHVDFPESTVDYRSWKERGWCRLEQVARVLSRKHTHMLLAWKEDTLFQVGTVDYLFDAVGDGKFSEEADRALLAPVMVALLASKLQLLLQRRDLRGYRRMLSTRATFLRGLPGVAPHQVCAPGFPVEKPSSPDSGKHLEAFMRLYGLRSARDRVDGTTEPILLAARDGDLEVVRALLDEQADVHAREGADDPEYGVPRGNTPLHVACVFNADSRIVQLLLRRRADPDAVNGRGVVPVVSAAFGGHPEIVAAMLDRKACVAAKDKYGNTALHMAAGMGRGTVCTQLIRAGLSAAPTKDGVSPLLWAVLFNAGRAAVEAILAAPDAGLEAPWALRWCSPMGLSLAALSVPRRLWGSQSTLAHLACEAPGMTPLMVAGFMGSVGEARALVAAGANLAARSARGRTAADLAEMAGLLPRAVACLQDPDLRVATQLFRLRAAEAALSVRLAEPQASPTVDRSDPQPAAANAAQGYDGRSESEDCDLFN